ncbi:hypothetical protein BJX76DRAFT_324039 [Aspergillus varians]
MSTPERKSGQTAWARRQQQQQQQHNSPFRRARQEPLHLDASHGLSPPRESPARHRRNFSKTGTLRGAFEYASRLPLSEIEDDVFLPQYAQRGSPRKRQQSANRMSSRADPPELEEAYKQIDDAISLTDLGPSDGENDALYMRSNKLNRRISTPASKREHRLSTASDASFTSESPRRRFADYAKDEERLKRATTSQSPVLDRVAIRGGPSSEHLQRRDSGSRSTSEEDYGIEPSMKAPSTWGSRGKYGNNWMKSLTRSHERGTGSTTQDPAEASTKLWDEISSKRTQQAAESREIVENRPVSRHGLLPPPLGSTSPERNGEPLSGGQKIPNTPISIFPISTFTKRSPTKRDSHDLLRKLARTGSPGQKATDATQTPQPTTTERRVYDKTPVVTGAWIDTPMTQRVPASQPMEVTKARGPNLDNAWGFDRLAEEANRKAEKAGTLIPKFEPTQEKVNGEKPPAEQSKEKSTKGTFWSKDILEEHSEEQPQEREPTTQEIPNQTAQESKQDWKRVELSLPDHPKSALETVLQDHKNNKDSLDVGDDTIESLQAILDQKPNDDTQTQQEDDAAYEKEIIGQLESAQCTDMNDFNRIEGKLQSLSDTMSNLKSGLNQLGNRVSRDTEYIISTLSKSPVEKIESEPTQLHESCETCRTRKNSVIHKGIPLPRLWNRGSVWWMTRPTHLGWCALIALAWYLSESTMCDYYCHPLIDSRCEGNCLLPDAPRFPFVIPTMTWRWFHFSDILVPLWAIIVTFFRVFTQLIGLSDGYVDDEPPALNLTGKIWVKGTQVDSFASIAAPTSNGPITPVAQWAWDETTHVPESVPDITVAPDSGSFSWDDISMDEDEFL